MLASRVVQRAALRVTERTDIVVGADGRNSLVAEAVRAEKYNERPPLLAPYYAYWSGLPMNGRFETYIRPNRGFAAAQTHDGLTMIVGGWPYSEFATNKKDIEGNYLKLFELAPELCRPPARGKARGAVGRCAYAQLLPQALRSGLGSCRRRGLHQGPDHRTRHQRCLPRCRALRGRIGRRFRRSPFARRGDGRLPARSRC